MEQDELFKISIFWSGYSLVFLYFMTVKSILSVGITLLATASVTTIKYLGTPGFISGIVLCGSLLIYVIFIIRFTDRFPFIYSVKYLSSGIATFTTASVDTMERFAGTFGAVLGGVIGAGIGMIFAAFEIWEFSDVLEHDRSFRLATAFINEEGHPPNLQGLFFFIHRASAKCLVSIGIITVAAGFTTALGYFASAAGAVFGGMFGAGIGMVFAVRLIVDTGELDQIGRRLVHSN